MWPAEVPTLCNISLRARYYALDSSVCCNMVFNITLPHFLNQMELFVFRKIFTTGNKDRPSVTSFHWPCHVSGLGRDRVGIRA